MWEEKTTTTKKKPKKQTKNKKTTAINHLFRTFTGGIKDSRRPIRHAQC